MAILAAGRRLRRTRPDREPPSDRVRADSAGLRALASYNPDLMSEPRKRAPGAGSPHPLEPTALEMKAMAAEAMERIARFIETLPVQPASDLDGAEALAKALSRPMPERGAPLGPVLDI